ncbi:cadherin-like domain-containing protein [Planctomycetes bacterium K23_9]|uniref:Cadherin domain-containing protein n=1 Tax=Stieleria marina TaxID=1930275 RepID=A0A517NNS8_9BACT|nr:hypothetical protein K239x_07060 [Planctomycetes bacterium K23_9]
MKNLRHKLLPTQWFGSPKRRQRPQPKSSNQRRLRSETLEKRELLAGDLLASDFRADVNPHHNGLAAVDANVDGWVTPSDILVVLNALAEKTDLGGAALGEEAANIEFKVDINNDDVLTPADALMVINDLNENGPHAMNPVVEFVLTARDLQDNLLPEDANGNISVDVNEIFQLEIGYNDLRGLSATGVFTQFLNLQTGVDDNLNGIDESTDGDGIVSAADGEDEDGGILTPAMTEFQELAFDRALDDSSVTGDYVFSIEGQSTTYTVSRADMASGITGPVIEALEAFGYDQSDFEVKFVQPTSDTAPFRFQIRYTDFLDPAFRNVNLPNITVAANLSVASDVTTFTASPVNSDGSINGAAVPFNIDFSNRFFNGQDVYGFNAEGDFSDEDGYIAVGATQLGAALSVPDKIGRPLPTNEPMESFSLPVFLNTSVTAADPLNVGIEIPNRNTEKDEYLLVFSEPGRLDESLVVLGEDASVSIITNATTANTAPTVAAALTRTATESDGQITLDLLAGANDVDNDPLTIINAVVDSGDPKSTATPPGTAISGNNLVINPSAYASLGSGDMEVIVYSFQVSDGRGGTVNQTATVTINGEDDANNAPTATPISVTFTEDDSAASIVDLIPSTNVNDPDGDTLTVSNVTLTSTSTAVAGVTIDEANTRLNVNPQANGELNDGESRTSTFSYTISDGNGGSVSNTVTVTVTGITDGTTNTVPVLATSPIVASFSEDDANDTVNLLAGATDADGDTLSVAGYTVTSGDATGVVLAGSNLAITPSAYNSLAAGTTAPVVATYTVTDGNGGNVSQTVTVTFNGVNDAPTVAGPLTQTRNESDATSFDLLGGATDPDTGDVLSVTGATVSGTALGVTVSGSTLNFDTAANAALNTGDTATAMVTYQIIDGNGGSVSQTATITINGEGTTTTNNAPTVSGALSDSFLETAGAQTVNLLEGATDADGDTLTVSGLTITGDTSNATTNNGNTLSINPAAYASLNDGEFVDISYAYTISDGNGGSVGQTATVRINGVTQTVNSAPTVDGNVSATFNEDQASGTVNLLSGATDADGDTLTVENLTLANGSAAGITVSGNTLNVNPDAYGDGLDAGDTATITYTYTISDGNGGSVAQTAVITITGADDGDGTGKTVKGRIAVGSGGNSAVANRLAGIPVTLSSISSGISKTALTNLQGDYTINDVPPGEYTISYDLPSSVRVSGSTTSSLSVSATDDVTNVPSSDLGSVILQGAISSFDILASHYAPGEQTTIPAESVAVGSVQLDSSGNQVLFTGSSGMDGIQFAEIALSANRDSALLTVLEDDGDVLSVRLSSDQFHVTADGSAVRFFGDKSELEVISQSAADSLSQEFANYRDAIDQILSQSAS